jgi:hypothetical protein
LAKAPDLRAVATSQSVGCPEGICATTPSSPDWAPLP